MATLKQIQFKRSKTAGARPAASVLAEGELAINLKDRTIFTKDDSGQIIDLGFAKGGQVDGDVTINGKLTLNGAYVQTLGGINTTGGINAGASIGATTYYALGGSFYARAPDAETNAHVWFENTGGGERGVIWAIPNTSDLGQVKIRAKTTDGVFAGEYSFRSDGRFDVPVAVKIGGAAMLTKDGNITSGSLFGGNLNNYLSSIKNDIVAGDNKKVSKTGDTMTGNLTINANLKVENTNGTFVDLGSEESDKYSRLTLARKVGDSSAVAMLKVTPEGYVQFGYQPNVANSSPSKYILIKSNGLEVEGDLVFKQTYRGVEEAVDITGATIDLNSLIIRRSDLGTRKLYKCTSSGGGSNILNKPTSDGNFTLEVLSLRKVSDSDWTCKQTFTTKSNNVIEGVYVRYGQNGTWSEWKEVVAGVQPINLGGTGATSVAAARNNLGVGEGQTVSFGNLVTNDLTVNGNARLVGRLNFGSTSATAGVLRANEGGAIVLGSASGANIHIRAGGADTSTGETRFEPNGNVVVSGALTSSGSLQVNGEAAMSRSLVVSQNIKNTNDNSFILMGKDSDLGFVKKNGAGSKLVFASGKSFTVAKSSATAIANPATETYTDVFKVDADGNQTVYGNATVNGVINANGGSIVVNAPTQASSNYIQGRKAGVAKWYVGIGDDGDAVRLHNNVYYHGIGLSADTVDITKPLKVGNTKLGTDGNITGGSGNFSNLNTTLNRKVNIGTWSGVDKVTGWYWYKFATVTMPQSASTARFKIIGGNGYNANSPEQASISEIVLRTGNNNPKSINATLWSSTSTSPSNIATVNTSGDNYDVYIYMGSFAQSLLVEYDATDTRYISVIGLNGASQSPVEELPVDNVKGRVFKLLNNSSGVFDADSSNISTNATFVANTPLGFRHKSNGDESGSAATLLYNDGNKFHILLTDKNTNTDRTKASGSYNSLRPFSIDIDTGKVTISHSLSVYGISDFYNDIALKNNGYIHFNKSGANPRNMSISHAGDATRGNRIEIADESNYLVYFQRLPSGANQCSFNSAALSGIAQTNSFGINTVNAWGGNSITIGDDDTGFRQVDDGILEVWTNNVRRMRFQSGDTYSDMNINAPNVYIRSDIRLKSNFKPIENALDKVEQLDGLIYDKADYIGGEVVHTEAGVIAQNLKKVLPEAIREVDDIKGNKVLTVSTQAQVALLIEAVKTLSTKVKELEAKLN